MKGVYKLEVYANRLQAYRVVKANPDETQGMHELGMVKNKHCGQKQTQDGPAKLLRRDKEGLMGQSLDLKPLVPSKDGKWTAFI